MLHRSGQPSPEPSQSPSDMLIRKQLLLAAVAAVALVAVAAGVTVRGAREELASQYVQTSAQRVAHEVTGLLLLTQDYARHGEPRAAQQWRQRLATIDALLKEQAADGNIPLRELQSAAHALPELFNQLEGIQQSTDEFSVNRRELIFDQLLTNAQTMSDSAYQWYQDAALARDEADRRFQAVALTVPAVMLAMIVAGGVLVWRRILRPLGVLTKATGAVAAGDLSVRIGTKRKDEFGDVKRRFDRMTEALAGSREQVDRSERQLRSVMNNIPAAVSYVDANQVYRFANGMYQSLFGIDPASLIGNSVKQRLGADGYETARPHIEGVLAGRRESFQQDVILIDKQQGHFQIEYVPDVDAEGTVAGFFAMVMDVTARKRAELALAKSERLLSLVANNVPVLISYLDVEGRFRFANDQYRRTFGVDPRQMLGATVGEALGEDVARDVLPHIESALNGQAQRIEREVRRGDKALYLQSDYIPDIAEDGQVSGIFVLAVDITELKQVQLAHARGEERLRTIADNLPALITYTDAQERFTFVNAFTSKVLGLEPEHILGVPLSELAGFPYAALEPHIKAALQGEPQSFEGMRSTARGPRHLQSNYIPDLGPDGQVRGFYAMTFDITERREAEKRLEQSERLLRDLTNQIPAMVGYFDRDERCLFANHTVLQVHGYAEPDTTLHTLRSGVGEESYALHAAHIPAVLAGKVRRFEGHIQHRGKDAYFQAHMIPSRSEDGEVNGFYVMSFDVTALRRAEQARANSEERLRQIADNLPVLISYIDKNRTLTFANATYRHWLGVDPKAIVGMNIRDAVGPKLFGPRERFVEQALGGERVEFENEAMTPLGLRTTHTAYVPDIAADGEVQGIYALSSDVTQLKQAELKLKALARSDALTSLPNRLSFNEKIVESMARQQRHSDCLALFFLDIDRFKSINDSYGHAAGDEVLKEFAKRLLGCVRKTDTVARLAGDEFVVILEGLQASVEAAAIAEKIIGAMRVPFDVAGSSLDVTTSIGIAYRPTDAAAETPSDLLNRADEALYKAKDGGRNTYHLAEADA